MLKQYLRTALFFLFSMIVLSACQTPAKQPTLSQTPIKVKTHASSYIYLSSIPKKQRTVYLTLQNDSGTDALQIKPWIVESLEKQSFVIVDNLDKANVAIRINTLRLGKIENDLAPALLNSEFGNSTPLLRMAPAPQAKKALPDNVALIVDLQYFERKNLISPKNVQPRHSMADLSDIQFLLLCNTTRWERFQTRIVSITFANHVPQEQIFSTLGNATAKANTDIVRGLSH